MGIFSARIPSWIVPLLESRCAACSAPVPFARGACGPALCPACAPALARRTEGYCPRCGNIAAHPAPLPTLCGRCLTTTRPWERFFFHGAYQGPLRDLILRFKSGRELPLANLFGRFLATHPDITGPYDALVPLPLHGNRLRARGFNQAVELARPLAKRLGAPIAAKALRRTTDTRPQAGLSLNARVRNVRGVFTPGKALAGGRLLVVDDVATTCATLEAAAASLRDAGARSVDVAVVARTPEYV